MDERDGHDAETEWEALGAHDWTVDQSTVDQSKRVGISPFEAAMAHGDGFSPLLAAHYRRNLREPADAWIRARVEHFQALQLHRHGFTASRMRDWNQQVSVSSRPASTREMAKGAIK